MMGEKPGNALLVFLPTRRLTPLRGIRSDQTIFMSAPSRSFYLSRDGGTSWNRRGGNLPFGDFTSILINPRNGDEVFVGNAYQTGEIGGGVYPFG